jgi:membrane protease YdiL (CAAX protease family)
MESSTSLFMSLLLLVFLIVLSVSVAIGFDLKKASSWLYVLCGFLLGLILGLTRGDLKQGIKFGIFSALFAIWGGTIMFRRRQQYKKDR